MKNKSRLLSSYKYELASCYTKYNRLNKAQTCKYQVTTKGITDNDSVPTSIKIPKIRYCILSSLLSFVPLKTVAPPQTPSTTAENNIHSFSVVESFIYDHYRIYMLVGPLHRSLSIRVREEMLRVYQATQDGCAVQQAEPAP